MRGAGLYLHVPFCSRICPYCDFSVTIDRGGDAERWVDAILAEAAAYAGRFASFDTLYFGGGTPSALSAAQLSRVLRGLRGVLPVERDAKLFLEANPEDVTLESVRAWQEAGVEFLSLGLQSFRDDALRFLGRRHDGEEARRAVESALAGGFETVSVDLIFGWDGHEPDAWAADLDLAGSLGVHHVSGYQLTFHPRTIFGVRLRRGEMRELADARQGDLFLQAHDRLARWGLPAYEVSNFARSDAHRSDHNQKYWCHAPYLGLGPSSHSFSGRDRWWNRRRFRDWVAAIESGEDPVEGRESLSAGQLLLERLMLALRTRDGFEVAELEGRYGRLLPDADRERFGRWQASGLVEWDGNSLRPSPGGLAVADGLAAELTWPGDLPRA